MFICGKLIIWEEALPEGELLPRKMSPTPSGAFVIGQN